MHAGTHDFDAQATALPGATPPSHSRNGLAGDAVVVAETVLSSLAG